MSLFPFFHCSLHLRRYQEGARSYWRSGDRRRPKIDGFLDDMMIILPLVGCGYSKTPLRMLPDALLTFLSRLQHILLIIYIYGDIKKALGGAELYLRRYQ
jgi:hypothetical protein